MLPPHVNRSGAAFDAGPGWIRAGLGRVKGLRGETIRRITAARTTGGPFVSIEDLVRRAGPDRREAERLILCGACAGLGRSRPEMLRALYLCGGRRRRPVELPLFGDAPAAAAASACRGAGTAASAGPHPPSPAPRVSEYDAPTAHALERGILGAHVTAHPLEAVGAAETPPGFIRAVALDRQAGRRVALVGWLVCTKRVRTSRGGQMRFLTFEDATALFEAVLFPDAYRRFGHLLRSPGPFAVRGLASDDGGAVVLKIDRLEPFPASSPRRTRPGISPRRCYTWPRETALHLPEASAFGGRDAGDEPGAHLPPARDTDATVVAWGGSQWFLPFFLAWALLRSLALLPPVAGPTPSTSGTRSWLRSASSLKRLLRRPVAVTAHGRDITFRFPLYRTVVGSALRRLDRVASVSRHTDGLCAATGVPAERRRIIPNGVDPDAHRAGPADREAALRWLAGRGIDRSRPMLLTVGRLVKRKGVARFVGEALPRSPACTRTFC